MDVARTGNICGCAIPLGTGIRAWSDLRWAKEPWMNDKVPKVRNSIVSQYLLWPTRTLEQAQNDAECRRTLTSPGTDKLSPDLETVQSADSEKPLSPCSGTGHEGGSPQENIEKPS